MKKKCIETWPLKVWCVCYRCIDYPGGWVPLSGAMYYYKATAEEESRNCANSKVKAFYVGPRGSFNGQP